MVIDWFLNFIVSMAAWLLVLFPDWSWTHSLSGYVALVFQKVDQYIGQWVPVADLFTMIVIAFTLEILFIGISLVNFIYNKFRGSGG